MQTQNSKWKIVLKTIFWFTLVVGALLNLPFVVTVFNTVTVLGGLMVITAVIAAIITLIIWGIKKLFRKDSSFLRTMFPINMFLFLSSIILIATPVWLALIINSTAPVTLPKVTMTDGEKTVIFQGMVHIGSENYYNSIIFDMVEADDAGYVLFYEGVRPGTDESEDRFNEIMGLGDQDLSSVYTGIADVCDLSFQNDFFRLFADDLVENSKQHLNMDVSTDDMIDEWERLLVEHPEYANMQPAPMGSAESSGIGSDDFMDFYRRMSGGQQDLTGQFCQAIFNLQMGLESANDDADPFSKYIILDYRNRYVADGIINADEDKIYITYGNAHFPGVYAYLLADDPDWEILDVQWRRALESPETFSGTLHLEE